MAAAIVLAWAGEGDEAVQTLRPCFEIAPDFVLTANLALMDYRSTFARMIGAQAAGPEALAIEIKRSFDPRPAKGFHSACEDVKPAAQFVVYPGPERFTISKKVVAVSLADLAAEIAA